MYYSKRLILILGLLSSHVFASEIIFKFIKGDVYLNGKKVQSKATKITAPYLIRTEKNSLAVVDYKNKIKLKINAESSIDLAKIVKEKTRSVELKKGSIFSQINKKLMGKEKFSLRVKNVAMGVRGTEFFTSLGEKDDIWMCVKSGLVEANSPSSKAVLIKAGEGISIKNDGRISDPKPLPWTEKLNWNMSDKGNLENTVDIKEAYSDPLDFDYD